VTLERFDDMLPSTSLAGRWYGEADAALKFLSSKRNALCVALSFGSLFGMRKSRFSTNWRKSAEEKPQDVSHGRTEEFSVKAGFFHQLGPYSETVLSPRFCSICMSR